MVANAWPGGKARQQWPAMPQGAASLCSFRVTDMEPRFYANDGRLDSINSDASFQSIKVRWTMKVRLVLRTPSITIHLFKSIVFTLAM